MASGDDTQQAIAEWQAEGERSPLEAQHAAAEEAGVPGEHPEVLVGAAFAGGFLLAQILKRFGGDD
jgi:hypothetical protein